MFAIGMSLRSKHRLIVFVGALLIVAEYYDVMIYNFGLTKTFRREKEKVSVSKEDFQRATDDNSIFVYSAYVEERAKTLRIIGITNRQNNAKIYCILRYKMHEQTQLVKGHVNHIRESHGRRYTAAFLLCDLTNVTTPDEVSVVDKPEESTRNVLPVRRILQQNIKHMFSACVSPLHSRFNDTVLIQEWVELNKLLGVDTFIFYINSVSKNVLRLLNYYENKGTVTLVPWTLPGKLSDPSYNLVHYFGQLAALNDCLYRTKGKSHYISSTDLDEYIVPQKPSDITWSDMLSRLPPYSVYIIRCSFFSQKEKCSRKKKCKKNLTIESYKLRDDLILPSHKRSKYIAKTDDVTIMGIHFTWGLHNGTEYTVSPDIALLHHYRKHSLVYTKAAFTKIMHRAAAKYTPNLHKNVKKTQNDVLFFSNKTEV